MSRFSLENFLIARWFWDVILILPSLLIRQKPTSSPVTRITVNLLVPLQLLFLSCEKWSYFWISTPVAPQWSSSFSFFIRCLLNFPKNVKCIVFIFLQMMSSYDFSMFITVQTVHVAIFFLYDLPGALHMSLFCSWLIRRSSVINLNPQRRL